MEVPSRFAVGQRVYRDDGGSTTVHEIDPKASEEGCLYRLAYDEGGEGWWPEFAIFASIAERDAEIGA